MPISCLLIIILLLLLTCGFLWELRVRAFSAFQQQKDAIEAAWRERERELTDRILAQAGVKPLIRIDREQIIKVPDPEAAPAETWEEAWHRDDLIKEEIEQVYPEAARLSIAELKTAHPNEWLRFETMLKEQKTPLRHG